MRDLTSDTERKNARVLQDLITIRKTEERTARMTAVLDAMPQWKWKQRQEQAAAIAAEIEVIVRLRQTSPTHEWLMEELHRRIEDTIRRIWRRGDGRGHPFLATIRATDALVQTILDETLRQPIDRRYREHQVSDVAELASLLNRDVIASLTNEKVAHYASIASDNTFYAQDQSCSTAYDVPSGPPLEVHIRKTVVQHAASGLRARFEISEGKSIGTVVSKVYSVWPLKGQGHVDWEGLAGLGIGRRIYLAAAHIHPDIRWLDGVTGSEYGAGVRRALHLIDPWRWEDKRCSACRDWESATLQSFTDHPRSTPPLTPSIEWV